MTHAIAIHGGAGTIRRGDLTPELEAELKAGLDAALNQGLRVLERGGAALEATVAAVEALEDNPLFNAGRGSVFTTAGKIEMEAAVMDGSSRRAGTVTGLRNVRNPVRLARLVMDCTPHVTLGFEAAEAFARDIGVAFADDAYFFTQKRWDALQAEIARVKGGGSDEDVPEDRKHGTVGAVALDAKGRLAAATSTGGRTAKWPGRIGDTPVIGAGTYADDLVAVSGTGHGEFFVRYCVAHDIAARIRYREEGVADAAGSVIQGAMFEAGGTGGVIAVDRQGRIAMPFNCEGMYRAAVDASGQRVCAIYRD